jgi:beta-phosphoglucomutase-like phosphatase (HAD superfamily)
VRSVLDQLAVEHHFSAVVSAEEIDAHKPAPDVYVEACGRLGVAPSDAIAFEDSWIGARAARAAGLMVIAVPSAPGMRIDADLTVGRLDDSLLLGFLGLAA